MFVELATVSRQLEHILSKRIMLLDGAYGTAIQQYQLKEKDFRGSLLRAHTKPLMGNNDLLVLTKPEIVTEIHESYLESGCDILSTNTFSSTKIAQSDFNTEHLCKDLNFQGAQLARQVADRFSSENNQFS